MSMRRTQDGLGTRDPALRVLPTLPGGEVFDPSAQLTDDHLVLIVPDRAQAPAFAELVEQVPRGDWLAVTLDGEGLAFLDPDLDVDQVLNLTSVTGVGAEVWHQDTPTPALQVTGDATIRQAITTSGLTSGMTYKLVTCGGVTNHTTSADNVLYEVSLTEPDRVEAKHESGTNVQHAGEWGLPFELLDDETYDVSARRSGLEWTTYLDGHRLGWMTSTAGGSDSGGGVFTASAAPDGGAAAVVGAERGRSRGQIIDVVGRALTPSEIAARVVSSRDPRVRIAALTDAEILSIFETGGELLFLLANELGVDALTQRVGALAGSWGTTPALVTRMLGEGSYGKGAGNTVGWRNTSGVTDVLVGGADFVYRFAGIWGEGDALGALRRVFGNSTASGSINVHAFTYFEDNSTLSFFHQHGSKTNSVGTFTWPFSFQDGDPFLFAIEQRDNEDGTQDVRVWANGIAATVAGVSGATDNGDGSARLTDGSVNGVTEWCWSSILFGTSTFSWHRFIQIDQATTTTEAEAALATAYLGATGRVGA